MAAFAALVSLMNNMEQIMNHPLLSTCLEKNQIESLGEKLDLLLDFVESHNSHGGISKEEAEDMESGIASAAHAAEDVIESHVVDRIESHDAGSTFDHGETSSGFVFDDLQKDIFAASGNSFLLDLQKILEEVDSVKEKVIKVKEERGFKDQQPAYSTPVAASSRSLTATGKTNMVGFDGYLIQLLEGLTGPQSDREIIPIVGMGGIGKTTLARNVYENTLIVRHFDVRAWTAVSQEYNVRGILFQTLSCLGESTKELDEKTEDELGAQLHKILFGRRYLIILDDMWSFKAWNEISFFFPENDNRSRIVVTTRQSDVAYHFGSLGLALSFLDEDKSWELFLDKVFPHGCCPPELENIGRNIVKKCKGLPLSIVVIGGLLGKSTRAQEYWENVEKNLSSILNSAEDNQCSNILSLSYSHLPAHLKPCFLYLGIFPEDHEIRVSKLIKLWVAEGFLKPNKEESLEEIAEGYIKDLVDRNLVLVRKLRLNGKLRACSIHDLLRDLCIKLAEKEKLFCVMRELDTPRDMDRERRIINHESISKTKQDNGVSMKSARSVIGQGCCEFLLKPRLLRVMSDASSSLGTTFQQVNLRFLENYSYGQGDSSGTYKLPSSISLLWNLQTLILTAIDVVAPSEIWEMPQLRHFCCLSIFLPDPPPSDKQDCVVLRNLQTLSMVQNFRCSEEVYKRMPNIRKLHIIFDDDFEEVQAISYYCHYNLGCLNKLESLLYNFNGVSNRDDLVQNLRFPTSLKKLTLRRCKLHWDDLTMIGSLPHLEVLKLNHSVQGHEWNPVEGGFCRLKFLGIYNCIDLVSWNADKSHFPVLEKLDLRSLFKLDEIPLGIGDIPTLGDICLVRCNVSVAISAMRIQEEQESLGNEDLRVQVEIGEKTDREEFRKQVELEGFSFLRHNFQLSYSNGA